MPRITPPRIMPLHHDYYVNAHIDAELVRFGDEKEMAAICNILKVPSGTKLSLGDIILRLCQRIVCLEHDLKKVQNNRIIYPEQTDLDII